MAGRWEVGGDFGGDLLEGEAIDPRRNEGLQLRVAVDLARRAEAVRPAVFRGQGRAGGQALQPLLKTHFKGSFKPGDGTRNRRLPGLHLGQGKRHLGQGRSRSLRAVARRVGRACHVSSPAFALGFGWMVPFNQLRTVTSLLRTLRAISAMENPFA